MTVISRFKSSSIERHEKMVQDEYFKTGGFSFQCNYTKIYKLLPLFYFNEPNYSKFSEMSVSPPAVKLIDIVT